MALSGISIYHVPEVVPGAGDTVVSKTRCGPCPHEVSSLLVDSDTSQKSCK